MSPHIRPRFVLVPTASLCLLLGMAACGTSSHAASNSGSTPVKVTLASYSITLGQGAIPAGKVTFTVTNNADIKHELLVLQTDTPADQLAVDKDGAVDESTKVLDLDEFAGPNVTKKESVTLKPGKYVLVCDIPGHYQQGMHAALTVQ
jgi:uncharacterized cupredoxin-like copper-binding protein